MLLARLEVLLWSHPSCCNTHHVQDYKATQKVAAEREAQYMPKVPPAAAAAARPGVGGSSGKAAAAAAAAAAAGGGSEADMEAQALLQVSGATIWRGKQQDS